MVEFFSLLYRIVVAQFKSRKHLEIENLALRHQINVLKRSIARPRLRPGDRVLWSLLSKVWSDWRDAIAIVQPETVVQWQKKRFKDHWMRLSKPGPGRPEISKEIQELIRTMSKINVTWGSPRIVGELAKLGIDLSKSSVEK